MCALLGMPMLAQGPYWAHAVGGLGPDQVVDVVCDAAGDIYATGEFSNSFTFDGQAVVAQGATDAVVLKVNSSGDLQWMVRAGGTDLDRGVSISVRNGAVAVTGHYTGTADLFGTTFTSQGGTMDAFVAQLDAQTGAVQWVRSGGGALYSDRSAGVALAGNGDVLVTGEFKGTALFDALSLTSMIDPLTLLPSFDVFVASYSNAGTLQWLQQGTAPHDDKGVAIAADAAGTVYVTGQYSADITFDQLHVNALQNSTFLIAFDAGGNEQWFRNCGGPSYTVVRDLALSSTGDLLVCGDMQGGMNYDDPVPVPIAAVDAYNAYLLRVSTSGALQAHVVEGSTNLLSANALCEQGGVVSVLGEFTCQFTGLSANYGDGVFMSTGSKDLFIARFALADLSYQAAQQFGGQGGKRAGGLCALANGALVFSGSMEQHLILPSDGAMWAGSSACPNMNENIGTYCSDAHYGKFEVVESAGMYDGFLSRGFVPGRSPYDFWIREAGGACDRSQKEVCIRIYGDTVSSCPLSYVACADPDSPLMPYLEGPQTPFSPFPWGPFSWTEVPTVPHTAPELDFIWSDGGVQHYTLVTASTLLSATLSTPDQCFSWTDDLDIVLYPIPTGTVSDGLGLNVVDPLPGSITVCGTDPVWLWYPTPQPGETYYWYGNGTVVPGDSILAQISDTYWLIVENAYGCLDSTGVGVLFVSANPLPNLTADIDLLDGLGGPLNGDTLVGCGAFTSVGDVEVEWFINGLPSAFPAGLIQEFNTSGGLIGAIPPPYFWSFPFQNGTGWYTLPFTINVFWPICSDTLTIQQIDSVYVISIAAPQFTLSGPFDLCAGDTVAIPLLCVDCDSVDWTGPGIVSTTLIGDTIWVNAPGTYVATAWNEEAGLSCQAYWAEDVVLLNSPPIIIDPADGIVCNGDSALLSTPSIATSYAWNGPDGPLATNNDSVWVSDLGDYYLTITDPGGCVLSNGPVEITAYGTPYMEYTPDNVVCGVGDAVTIQVFADPAANYQWQPPLQGSGAVQVVDAPGSYVCTVTSCGVTYNLIATISGPVVDASVADSGAFVLCPGDTVLLNAAPGQASYQWTPGGATTAQLAVTAPGNYQVLASDVYGCQDTSTVISVQAANVAEPLVLRPASACEGDTVLLQAQGSGLLSWFDDQGQLVAQGNSFSYGPAVVGATFTVVQEEGLCISAGQQLPLTITNSPGAPLLEGDGALCEGAITWLIASGAGASQFLWTTPVGTIYTDSLQVGPATGADGGVYACVALSNGCAGTSSALVLTVEPCSLFIPNVFSPNGDGSNDAFVIESPTGAVLNLVVFDRWGGKVHEERGPLLRWNGKHDKGGGLASDGVYYFVITMADGVGAERKWTGYVHLVH
ncbi:MAG: gliding motility-associated C-terminal domain-containing protein [Flavobacteriales bacterium]|nr:gliding motility-associated C-terminal domain-containing protein [Flavobacteriales bacterium]MBK9287848.1 gliding motility-associated C-terminal domain-containing protein [Flavobacteriales bacterium]